MCRAINFTMWLRPAIQRALLVIVLGSWAGLAHAGFDHRHAVWNALLRKHVVAAPDRTSSRVRYADFQTQRAALQAYLQTLSAVSAQDYAAWTRAQQLAFLINAYNAYTIELVLTRYPDLRSLKDLGGWFGSPWRKKFFVLLGIERSLDDVEHTLIRARGTFDDPRIHVAVVCASVGCPMLRNEAYVDDRLDAQLDDALLRFLSDHQRNRYDADTDTLNVSKIFDWYRADFEQGHRGITSLATLFARHADQLANNQQARANLRAGRYKLVFLDYDWALNSTP